MAATWTTRNWRRRTLFLPVWVPGANFSVGDGHGVQGDGEVCVTALEMCLTGTFTFVLHKGGGARARCCASRRRRRRPTTSAWA